MARPGPVNEMVSSSSPASMMVSLPTLDDVSNTKVSCPPPNPETLNASPTSVSLPAPPISGSSPPVGDSFEEREGVTDHQVVAVFRVVMVRPIGRAVPWQFLVVTRVSERRISPVAAWMTRSERATPVA